MRHTCEVSSGFMGFFWFYGLPLVLRVSSGFTGFFCFFSLFLSLLIAGESRVNKISIPFTILLFDCWGVPGQKVPISSLPCSTAREPESIAVYKLEQ